MALAVRRQWFPVTVGFAIYTQFYPFSRSDFTLPGEWRA
jgi:hypothetical protein